MSGITCLTCRYYRHISRKDYCFKKNKFLSSLDEAKTCNYYTPKLADDKKIVEIKGMQIEFSEKREEEELNIIGRERENKEREFLSPKKKRTKFRKHGKLKNELMRNRVINTALENKNALAVLAIFFIIVILLILRK